MLAILNFNQTPYDSIYDCPSKSAADGLKASKLAEIQLQLDDSTRQITPGTNKTGWQPDFTKN